MELEKVKLNEVLFYEQPTKYIVKSVDYSNKNKVPVLTAGKSFILGYTNETEGIFKEKLPVIIFDDFTTAIKYVDFPFKVKSSAMKILMTDPKKANIKYLFHLMQSIIFPVRKHKRHWISEYSQIEIVLPPLPEQERIANKLDRFFSESKIAIDGFAKNKKQASKIIYSELRAILDSEAMGTYSLEKICDTTSGGTPRRSNRSFYDGHIMWLKSGELNDNPSITSSEEHITDQAIAKSNAKILPTGTVLMAMYGATVGKLGILNTTSATNQAVCAITPHKNILNAYIYWFLFFYRDELINQAFGGAQPNISQTLIRKIPVKVPSKNAVPDLIEQKRIVSKINAIKEKTENLRRLFSLQETLFSSLRSSVLNQSFQINI